jgi:hypothetical protein
MITDVAATDQDRKPVLRAALIVGHPGHELRVHHWMEVHRPVVFCLTDGSGGNAEARIESTARLLEKQGAVTGAVFGRYTDKEIYRHLLDGRLEVFVSLTKELAQIMAESGVNCVAGDAVEGFNPMHDACRFIIDGAVAMMRRDGADDVRNYDFLLDTQPAPGADPLLAGAWWLRLDDAALERKLESAMSYPELRDEVQVALIHHGKKAFALECLRIADTDRVLAPFDHEPPAYERYGEMRVKEGRYTDVIRYREHVLPVRHAIQEAAR